MLIKYKDHVYYVSKRCRFYSSTTKLIKRGNLPSSAYQPAVVEKNKYENCDKNCIFKAENDKNKPIFSMVLPPPNVTGSLHLGHALTCTIQDVIVRRKRSQGYNVMWLPGIDHAGIATQGVVEKYLKSKHNLDRRHMTRADFNGEVWKWKEKYGDRICEQLRIIGSSLDWSRKIFTMDPNHSHAVDTAFITLFKKGLIYRKKALINWCNKLQSTISDIEIENLTIEKPREVVTNSGKVKFGFIYDFAYKIEDSSDELVVSTTMPETMLGDVAIAVHCDDERYKHLKGRRVVHPFRNETIPIIFDNFVDMKFGTGAVKITPAHSKVDYEVAQRHNLPLIQIINEKGSIVNSNTFNNVNKYECRDLLIMKLDELGLLKEAKAHAMTLPICSRTGDVIEYLPKEQWFLSCKELNKQAVKAVKEGRLRIEPEKFVKNWLQWTEDDRDWCISRQLWWGHQIPAYKCTASNKTVWVSAFKEENALMEASETLKVPTIDILIERDTDVLDTWFSSGIYPFSSLGWPNQTPDFELFYPLSLMATGHDILGFWVHRMVILGLELTGKLPFNKVLLHGVICDNKGAKMSKSKGNVIDPIDIINGISIDELNSKSEVMHEDGILTKEELINAKNYQKANFSRTNGIPECGVDALRFTILSHDIKSHYTHFDIALCHRNKLFCNKIWQSVKYIQMSLEKLTPIENEITRVDLNYFDKWILSKLANMVRVTNEAIDNYDFHLATRALKTLIYNEYCDVYLEATKSGFENTNGRIGYAHAHTLIAVLNTALRALAPFMIYITEELIPKIPAFENNIIYNFKDDKYLEFPNIDNFEVWKDEILEERANNLLNTIFLVRQIKGFYGIRNDPKPAVIINTTNKELIEDLHLNDKVFKHLSRSGEIIVRNGSEENYVSAILNKDTKVNVEVIGDDATTLIQTARSRLEKKVKKAEESLAKLEAKFSSENYVRNVPEFTQIADKDVLLGKKEELKQLQRLIVA